MSDASRSPAAGALSAKRVGALAAVALLAFAHGARAADGPPGDPGGPALPLREAMRLALAQSPALAGRFVDRDLASDAILQASGLDDFSVGASGSWTHSRGPNVPAQSTPLLPYDTVDLSAALVRPLSTGGTVSLKLDAPYLRAASSLVPGAPGDSGAAQAFEPSAQLALTQPLLRGRGYDVARAPLRQARAARDVAEWELEAAASALIHDVSDAYWELAYAAGDLALRASSLEAARAQLRATEAQISVGKQPPSASAEVEVSIALRQDETLDAESAVPQRAAELARLLGMPPQAAMRTLRASDVPPLAGAPAGDLVARALERNQEIAALRAQGALARIGVDVARNGLLPQLDVTASGGPMGVGTEAGPALRTMATFGGYGVQAGLLFQEPIERRAQRGARDAANDTVLKAGFAESDARARVAGALAVTVSALDSTQRRVEVLLRAVRIADLDLEGEEARFQANRSTNFDVLRRQQAATDVRIRLLRAQVDNAKAAAALDALTGDLLARHGLALRDGGRR